MSDGARFEALRYRTALAVGQRIKLDASAAEALRARAVSVSEAFTLVDAAGGAFRASLQGLDGDRGEALVYEAMDRSPEPSLRVTLLCAVLARQRMLLVTQKATELGVWRVQPVFTTRSVGPEGLVHEKAHAWQGQAIKGAKQSRRASVPEVLPSVPLAEALGGLAWKTAAGRWYLDDRAGVTEDASRFPEAARDREAVLCIGPEGGWTDDERAALTARGAQALRLGGRVLRAETAVFAGLAVLQHRLGDLR
ncbi:MAG: 16S rRNA (uracil(1498)-N(3))-methyltransferase [Deltaproteobacteria bacterium]|nr:16S rRNA (uracil(1498)-N(3))-methyltransferase [Deltaproteobacteria bacterium]